MMLTDIFADRYDKRVFWEKCTEAESKLLNQSFRIVAEQLYPYKIDGKEWVPAKLTWQSLHDRLSRELGVDHLSPTGYRYEHYLGGQKQNAWYTLTVDIICKNFVCGQYTGTVPPDRFVKERLSFIELAFREKDQEVQLANEKLGNELAEARIRDTISSHGVRRQGLVVPGSAVVGVQARNDRINKDFGAAVDELNERFRRAGAPLGYHNGFIQVAADALTEEEIEKPFWDVVADPLWKNVDLDLKEAIDRRDANDRDPVFYAARGLESAIKIISDQKGWTHGGEKGAQNYIDNLGAARNGSFIKDWERDALKTFFANIRNPFVHGPGSAEMPELSPSQTDWAIEACMSWVKSLVRRM